MAPEHCRAFENYRKVPHWGRHTAWQTRGGFQLLALWALTFVQSAFQVHMAGLSG